MKPIHECAVIKDGNKRSGYFIAEAPEFKGLKDVLSKPWTMVSSNEFEELVKQDRVQYLVWEDNRIKCRYTKEELKKLKGNYTKGWVEETEQHYWDMDLSFKAKHIGACAKHGALAISCAEMHSTLGMPTISLFIFGQKFRVDELLRVSSLLTGFDMKKFIVGANGGGHTSITVIMLPLQSFETMLDKFGNSNNLLFDTSTTRYYINNNLKRPSIPLIAGKLKPELILKTLDKCDRVSVKNEEKFKLSV